MFDFLPLDILTLPFIFTFAFIKYILGRITPWAALKPNDNYVLITGAGAGFGADLSVALDKQGWYVLAGVRSERSIEPLRHKLSSRAHVFKLDITDPDEVQNAIAVVKRHVGRHGLHCLVNNAGISGGAGPTDLLPMSEYKQVMNVNFFGQVAITKALMPFIYQAKRNDKHYGRVVNIASVAGIIAPPTMGSYTASKFALESFSDAHRREMKAWNVPVILVEPGFFATKMVLTESKSETDRVLMSATAEDVQNWSEKYIQTERFDFLTVMSENPAIAVKELVKAVTATRPSRRYRPGLQAALFFYPMSLAPTSVTDFFCPMIMGMQRPNPLSKDQGVNWLFYVSDFFAETALSLLKRVGLLKDSGKPPMTYDKLVQLQAQYKQEKQYQEKQTNGTSHNVTKTSRR